MLTLGNSFDDLNDYLNVSAYSDKVALEETHNHPSLEKPSNVATVLDGRCEGKFVSPNVINLPKRHLSKDEISLLSKGLKFIPRPKHIKKRLLNKNLKPMAEKLGLCGIIAMKNETLLSILLRKNLNLMQNEKMPP